MIIETNSINVPTSLDGKFFKEALEYGLREDRHKIHRITFASGSGGGENYSSQIYRVTISFSNHKEEEKKISIIVKSMPITEYNIFIVTLRSLVRERVMYFDILPRMELLLGTKFGPRCYYSVSQPIQTLVFEDLAVNGYVLADRELGLDEEHCRLLLSTLGKFHAASMVIAEKDPLIMRHFPKGCFSPYIIDHPILDSMFTNSFEYLANSVISEWPGFENIADKLRNMLNNWKEKAAAIVEPRKGEIKVLNHGDLWVNNFMYKYDKLDSTKPCSVAFFDFQLSFYSSPGIDLNHFLNTSVQLDVLKHKREQLIQAYYQSLETTLNDLRYHTIPTYQDIKNEIYEKEFYGFLTAVGPFALLAMEKSMSQDNSIETMLDDETAHRKMILMFSSKRFQDTMKYSLKRFDELGVLD